MEPSARKPIFDPEKYQSASRFAAEAHNGQLVPGTKLPYLLHVSQVAQEVIASLSIDPCEDADQAVLCALLHDTIEDAEVTPELLAEKFGQAVADGVQALTKNEDLPKDQQMADSLQRIRRQRSAVWRVKLADRITNLQPPPHHWDKAKCGRYRDEAETILVALAESSEFLASRLRRKIAEYDVYCR